MILISVVAMTVNLAEAKVQFSQAPVSAARDDNASGVLKIGDKQVEISFSAGSNVLEPVIFFCCIFPANRSTLVPLELRLTKKKYK